MGRSLYPRDPGTLLTPRSCRVAPRCHQTLCGCPGGAASSTVCMVVTQPRPGLRHAGMTPIPKGWCWWCSSVGRGEVRSCPSPLCPRQALVGLGTLRGDSQAVSERGYLWGWPLSWSWCPVDGGTWGWDLGTLPWGSSSVERGDLRGLLGPHPPPHWQQGPGYIRVGGGLSCPSTRGLLGAGQALRTPLVLQPWAHLIHQRLSQDTQGPWPGPGRCLLFKCTFLTRSRSSPVPGQQREAGGRGAEKRGSHQKTRLPAGR